MRTSEKFTFYEEYRGTSGQDGGIGRHTVPPDTTKRRTTNLKTKNNQNCSENRTVWKSDNQGDKEETFTQTGRRDRDGQLGGEDTGQGGGWWIWRGGRLQTGRSHIQVLKNREQQPGSETDHITQGSNTGKSSLKPLTENTCGG